MSNRPQGARRSGHAEMPDDGNTPPKPHLEVLVARNGLDGLDDQEHRDGHDHSKEEEEGEGKGPPNLLEKDSRKRDPRAREGVEEKAQAPKEADRLGLEQLEAGGAGVCMCKGGVSEGGGRNHPDPTRSLPGRGCCSAAACPCVVRGRLASFPPTRYRGCPTAAPQHRSLSNAIQAGELKREGESGGSCLGKRTACGSWEGCDVHVRPRRQTKWMQPDPHHPRPLPGLARHWGFGNVYAQHVRCQR